MMSSVWTLARLTWLRVRRGKTIWITGLLAAVPLALAIMTFARASLEAEERWQLVCNLTLRSLVLLAPVLHLATAINEENDGKTYTYLWSRPVPRGAVILGKMTAIVPLIAGAVAVALTLSWLIVGGATGELGPAVLGRTVLAAVAGVVGASAFAVGIGALFPRHPLVVSLGYIFFAEQILPMVKAVQNLSTLYHVHNLAGLSDGDIAPEEPATAALALVILSALWLGVALWRVRRLEFGGADG